MQVVIISSQSAEAKLVQWSILGYEQVKIAEASSYETAINICEELSPDLIYLDEGIDEFAKILAEIRSKDKNAFVVVLVNSLDDAENVFARGADDVAIKPLSIDVLKNRMRNYLRIIEYKKIIGFNSRSITHYDNDEMYGTFCIFKFLNEFQIDIFSEHFAKLQHIEEHTQAHLAKTINGIASLGRLMLNRYQKMIVFFEESQSEYYFTISRVDSVNPKTLNEVLFEYFGSFCEYQISNRRLYLKVQKISNTIDAQEMPPKEFDPVSSIDAFRLEGELAELLISVDDLLNDADQSEASAFGETLDTIGKIIAEYSQFYELGIALCSLGMSIMEHAREFVRNADMGFIFASVAELAKDIHAEFNKQGAVDNEKYRHMISLTISIESCLRVDEEG